MKIKVVSMMSSIRGENSLEMEVEFSIKVEDSNELLKWRVTFFEDGKIEKFPTFTSTDKSPYYYIAGGKLMEEIVKFEGERAKELYNKAYVVYKPFRDELNSIYSDESFEGIYKKRMEYKMELAESKFKSAKDESRIRRIKIELEKSAKIISYFEPKIHAIEEEARKALGSIQIDL